MRPLTSAELQTLAALRGLEYAPVSDPDPLVVHTVISKDFPLSQEEMYRSFTDPVSHVGLFSIIVSATSPIRRGLEGVLSENEFFAFEHVQESSLPPRIMLMKYTLSPPHTIFKIGVTDPFLDEHDTVPMDKKRAKVKMTFDKLSDNRTKLTTDSSFAATTGAVFARGFIDHVWFNFYERMMVANGQIRETEMQTEPKLG